MKVCQVTSVHGRYDGRIFQKISTSLANNGYDTYLLCLDNKPDEVKNGVKIVSATFHPKNRMDRILNSWKPLYKKALEIDADIYHFHDPELLKLGLKLKKKGKRIIFDSHEDYPMQILAKNYIPKFLRKVISKMFIIREKKALKSFDGVISATGLISNKLAVFNKNSIAIMNFAILEDYVYFNSVARDYKQVCYVGGVSVDRGIGNLIEATKNKNYLVKIAGGNDDETKKAIGFNTDCKNIELLGYLPKNDVWKIYKDSCIGFCILKYTPNHFNAFPIKIFEYMAAGLAIICSNFPIYKEIVEDNNCGICVDPEKVEDISKVVDYLMANPEIIRTMGENGQKAVKEQYNWASQEVILLDFYKELER